MLRCEKRLAKVKNRKSENKKEENNRNKITEIRKPRKLVVRGK